MALREWLDGLDPDNMPDDWVAVVRQEMDDDASITEAKIAELQAANDLAVQEIATLKARNYDLLSAVPNDGDASQEDESNDPDEPTIDDVINQMKGGE